MSGSNYFIEGKFAHITPFSEFCTNQPPSNFGGAWKSLQKSSFCKIWWFEINLREHIFGIFKLLEKNVGRGGGNTYFHFCEFLQNYILGVNLTRAHICIWSTQNTVLTHKRILYNICEHLNFLSQDGNHIIWYLSIQVGDLGRDCHQPILFNELHKSVHEKTLGLRSHSR